MPKDNQYWKEYNQKRKAYLALKKKESREKLKRLSTITLNSPWLITPKKVVDYQTTDVLAVDKAVVDTAMVVDNTFPKVVDEVVDTRTVVDKASLKVVDQPKVVDNCSRVVDINHQTTGALAVVDQLTHLIHLYQTNTAYNCTSTCSQNKYCSNCWYFEKDSLLDYKAWSFAG